MNLSIVLTRVLWIPTSAFFLAACTTAPEQSRSENAEVYSPNAIYDAQVGAFPAMKIAADQVPEGITAFTNLTYVEYGNRSLSLDLYAPTPTMKEARPAIVLVHGGNWQSGKREYLAPLAQQLALRGYVTAAVDYRLATDAKYPAAIHDVKSAIRWMKTNAKTYGINPDRIAVAGAGVGGHIASLVGVTNGVAKFDPQASSNILTSDVKVVINIDGVVDFTSDTARNSLNGADPTSDASIWLGGSYKENPQAWHEVSPIQYVNQKTTPMLFIVGEDERYSMGIAQLTQSLEASGVNFHQEKIRTAPHGFWMFEPWLEGTVKVMANYLDARFTYRMSCH